MDWIVFDVVVVGIILFFAISHLIKGGIYSVLAVGSLLISIIITWMLRDLLVLFYAKWITYKPLCISLSMLSIFIPLYTILKIISSRINGIVSVSPFFFINRLIGFAYGALKGFVIIIIFISIARSYNQFNTRFFSTTITGPTIQWGVTYMDKVIHTNKRDISRALVHSTHTIRNNIRHVTPRKYKRYISR